MKLLVSFLLSLVLLTSSSFVSRQTDVGDTIKWTPTAKLTWSDFRKTLQGNSIEAAYSVCGLDISANPQQVNDSTYTLDVQAFFSKTLSAKTNEKDMLVDKVLAHEQGHFDITEWYARMLRKQICETKFTNAEDFFKQVQDMYNKTNTDYAAAQGRYDKGTAHSMNETGQEKWNKMIADGLAQYGTYSSPHLKITLKH